MEKKKAWQFMQVWENQQTITEVYECPSHLKNHHEDERDRDFFPEAVEPMYSNFQSNAIKENLQSKLLLS